MAQDQKQDIFFFGGLNSDDMYENIPQGDYISAIDINNNSISSDNQGGKVVPRKGNKLVNNTFLEDFITVSEDNDSFILTLVSRKSIGSVKDEATNKLYYFVYEVYSDTVRTVTKYSIFEYDNNGKIITNRVARTNLPIFLSDDFIKFGTVLYGRLFWVQAGIEPKSIDIERSINYNKNQYGGTDTFQPAYLQMNMQEYNVYRRPPITPIKTTYGFTATVITNSIRGKLFQFRYRYVYNDNTESVWSPISTVALPINEMLITGLWNESIEHNHILLQYDVNNFDIKEVQIAKREYSGATDTVNNFEIIAKVSFTNFVGTYYYGFRNDVAGEILSTNENNNLLYHVPLSCNAMDVISNPDKVVYGGDMVEPMGRGNILPNVTLDVTRENIETITTGATDLSSLLPFDSNNIRTSLLPYRIERAGFKLTYNYNYAGVYTAIYIPDDYLTLGADTMIINISFDPIGNDATTIVAIQINISGITDSTVLKQAIVSKINDYIQTQYEVTDTVAWNNSANFEHDVTPNVSPFFGVTGANEKQWLYKDLAFCDNNYFFSNSPTLLHPFNGYFNNTISSPPATYDTAGLNRCVFIATGQITQIVSGLSQTIIVEQKTLYTGIDQDYDDIRYSGYALGVGILNQNNDFYSQDNDYFTIHADRYWFNFTWKFFPITEYDNHLYQRGVFAVNQITIVNNEVLAETPPLVVRNTLAPFGRYGVGIVYFDEALRPSFVQECGNASIQRYGSEYETGVIYKIKMDISHTAPDWAKYWMPVVSDNRNQQKFFEIDVSIDTAANLIEISGEYVKIRVNDAINLWLTQYGNTGDEMTEYTFAKGDRIVLYHLTDEKYYDKEIVKQDDSGYIYVSRGSEFNNSNEVSPLINIYNPKKTVFKDFYYEVGEINDVLSGGRHKNNKNNVSQTTNTPLEYIIDYGDVYLNVINNYRALIEPEENSFQPTYNEYFRAFYPSRLNNKGRVHIANKLINLEPIKDRIRISNASPDNAFVKQWNKFDEPDRVDMGDKYGSITGLVTVGYTLKVITELKLIRIYVNRAAPVNEDGSESLILTDRTIGAISVPEYNYGCKHPTSIIKNDRDIYYVNSDNGFVIKDSANGQTPISKYKYNTYFQKLLNVIRADNNIHIISGFNKDDAEYVLIINNDNSRVDLPISNEYNGVVFHEDTNRWKTHKCYRDADMVAPEWSDFINNTMLTFLNGNVYIDNADDVERANYYGQQYIPNIEFVINAAPKKIKTFHAISIHATDKWDMQESGDIQILPTTTYPNGMSSRLKPNKLVDKEGVFYSEFMGDGLSKETYIQGLINGRQLRGNVMLIKIRNSEVQDTSELFSTSVIIKTSEHSY